jgi:hypothetical protein
LIIFSIEVGNQTKDTSNGVFFVLSTISVSFQRRGGDSVSDDKFGFAQGSYPTNGTSIRYARVTVPGCGRKEKDDAPIILIEIDDKTGKITMEVYGDILSEEPTHIIPLGGAKLELKGKKDGD